MSETFNLWKYKPWWCQPWSILLTGIVIIVSSWILFSSVWLTIALSAVILVWWLYFLIILPKLLANSLISESDYRLEEDSIKQSQQK